MKKITAPRTRWTRSSVALGAALCVLSLGAQAQQSTGSISGRASAEGMVSVENKSIGITRQVKADKDGSFQLSQLPPGTYTVTVTVTGGGKETRQVVVTAGAGAFANFAGEAQRVVVSGAVARTLDMSTVESNFTLTKDQLDRLPVGRDVTAVTLLAPGAVFGDSRIGQTGSRAGNVPSISGASPAENAYYINGFNVTNIVNGVAFNQVPFEAVAEQQVKTGGYSAEYGRSLGGVININTKRGTNEWKGGVSLNWEPDGLRGSSVYSEKDANGNWQLKNRPGSRNMFEANAFVGGPVIPDRLYVFGLVQGSQLKSKGFGISDQSETNNDSPQYLLKVDWNLTKDNLVELTAFSDKSKDKINTYDSITPYQTARGALKGKDVYTNGGENVIGKWTSFVTPDLTLSAMAGVGKYARNADVGASSCPIVQDRRISPAVVLGCYTDTTINRADAGDTRTAYRLDAEWVLGKHTLRAGLDNEVYDTIDGTRYSGGQYFFLQTLKPGASLPNGYTNTTGAPLDYVNNRIFANGGTFQTKNSAWYVEDNFQVTKDILVNLGLRNESFNNLNDQGKTFIKVDNTWAPRAGFNWNLGGDGQTKVYGNLGRYYIPVYANTNVRLSGTETNYRDYYAYGGTLSSDGKDVPVLGAKLGDRITLSDGLPKDPRTVVDPNLKPMFQDEVIMGFQMALADRWSAGVKYTHRDLKSGMDDICEGDLTKAWALANGYSAADAKAIGATVSNCFLYNPGKDLVANVDLGGADLTAVRIPAAALLIPKPKRTYDAFEFTLERQWDKKWSLQASYVLAFSKGNTEGYVKSDIGQDDAGISQDFDHPGLMVGASGYLPNDRRHTFKVNGSYAVSDEWRFGASALAQSGRPVNCFGVYPNKVTPAIPGLIPDASASYGGASFYCDGKPVPRGSLGRLAWTYDLGLQATYTPTSVKGLTLNANILNVFNKRTVRAINEVGEEAVGSPDPAYRQPISGSIQSPRRVRLTANYEF